MKPCFSFTYIFVAAPTTRSPARSYGTLGAVSVTLVTALIRYLEALAQVSRAPRLP